MFEVLFTQDSKIEDLFCGASSSSEPSLFFSNHFFSLGFEMERDCCEFICGALTTFQGYGIKYRIETHKAIRKIGSWLALKIYILLEATKFYRPDFNKIETIFIIS